MGRSKDGLRNPRGVTPFFHGNLPGKSGSIHGMGRVFFIFFFELTKLGFSKSSWTMSWTGIRFRNQPEKSSGVSKKRNFDKFDQVETPTHGTGTYVVVSQYPTKIHPGDLGGNSSEVTSTFQLGLNPPLDMEFFIFP